MGHKVSKVFCKTGLKGVAKLEKQWVNSRIPNNYEKIIEIEDFSDLDNHLLISKVLGKNRLNKIVISDDAQ